MRGQTQVQLLNPSIASLAIVIDENSAIRRSKLNLPISASESHLIHSFPCVRVRDSERSPAPSPLIGEIQKGGGAVPAGLGARSSNLSKFEAPGSSLYL